jgi:hypothetical protein
LAATSWFLMVHQEFSYHSGARNCSMLISTKLPRIVKTHDAWQRVENFKLRLNFARKISSYPSNQCARNVLGKPLTHSRNIDENRPRDSRTCDAIIRIFQFNSHRIRVREVSPVNTIRDMWVYIVKSFGATCAFFHCPIERGRWTCVVLLQKYLPRRCLGYPGILGDPSAINSNALFYMAKLRNA